MVLPEAIHGSAEPHGESARLLDDDEVERMEREEAKKREEAAAQAG